MKEHTNYLVCTPAEWPTSLAAFDHMTTLASSTISLSAMIFLFVFLLTCAESRILHRVCWAYKNRFRLNKSTFDEFEFLFLKVFSNYVCQKFTLSLRGDLRNLLIQFSHEIFDVVVWLCLETVCLMMVLKLKERAMGFSGTQMEKFGQSIFQEC